MTRLDDLIDEPTAEKRAEMNAQSNYIDSVLVTAAYAFDKFQDLCLKGEMSRKEYAIAGLVLVGFLKNAGDVNKVLVNAIRMLSEVLKSSGYMAQMDDQVEDGYVEGLVALIREKAESV